MTENCNNERVSILGTLIASISYKETCQKVLIWQMARESRMVCFANVHMVMTAYDSPAFKSMLNNADIVTPDGMPLVWALRIKGYPDQQRVYGPTLTLKLLEKAEEAQIPVGFYGSTPEILERLQTKLRQRYPKIDIAYAHSPPFRPLTEAEDLSVIEQINASGARILFVGLGCPKQEIWMAQHRDKIQAVMLGVGAAFDFHAGMVRQAPSWIQKLGLEWLFRLSQEPRRLWRRYLFTNPRFMFLIVREILLEKVGRLRG